MARLQSNTWIYGTATITGVANLNSGILFSDGSTLSTSNNIAGAFTAANVAYGRIQITANTNGGIFANGTQGASQTGNVLISISNTHITNAVTSNTTMGLQLASAGIGVAASGITGEIRASTAAAGTSNTMLATTAFVGTAATNIVVPPFNQANNAFNVANAAFSQANNAPPAFNQANNAFNVANASFTAANVAYGRIQLTANTGDLLANGINTPVTGNILLGLATTAVSAGTYGGTTQIPVITIDTKGRATYAANIAVSIPAGTFITANTNGALFANGTQGVAQTGNVLISLANTAVTAGTYGGSTQIPVVTIDGSGRATYAANVTFSGGASITDDTISSTTQYLLAARSTSGTLSTVYTDSTGLYYNVGTGTLNSTIFNSLSDKNKKKKIKKIKNALDVVNQLNGVEFEWKSNSMKSYGVIAQELEEIVPDLVTTDDIGNKSVNYNGLFGFLINAIKEQQKQIDKLTEK